MMLMCNLLDFFVHFGVSQTDTINYIDQSKEA